MNIPEHVIKYATEQGFGKLEFIGTDEGVNYYAEINESKEIVPTGLPCYIADNHEEVYIACGLETLELPF